MPIGSAGVHEWLPQGRIERQQYDAFLKYFGNDQVILGSWDDCSIDDPRLRRFSEQLVLLSQQPSSRFARIESTDDLCKKLTDAPLRLSQHEAEERLRGFMIGRDGTAAVLIIATELGVQEQAKTIEAVFNAADQTAGLGREKLRMAGAVFESYAVDRSAGESLVRLVPLSSILGLLVAWCCLRRLRYAISVLALAGLGQLIAVALVYYTGKQFSAVLIVLPTLVFMLTLSGAVHLMNYFRDSRLMNASSASSRAVMLGWKPCVLSSVTTVFGMGSLWTSQLSPIREFGLYAAIALAIATVVLLLLFPTVVDAITPEKRIDNDSSRLQIPNSKLAEGREPSGFPDPDGRSNWSSRYLDMVARNASAISISSIVVLIASIVGLSFLKASTKFNDMFPLDSRINQDMFWIEEHIGPISTVEVLLTFPDACSLSTFDRLDWIARVGDGLREQPEVGGVMSAVSFLPRWTDQKSVGAAARRGAVRKAVENNLPQLLEQKWVADTEDGQVWRLVSKVSATSSQDYGELVAIVKKACQDVLKKSPPENGIDVHFTGLTPIMHQTQVTLLRDLGFSFLTAFLLITPIMMWVTGSLRGGLLAMIPNVLPISVVFGTMGWLGFKLDIAGILTASVALGIAVDDTLHFICWHMSSLRSGASKQQAVFRSFHACSSAMMHTTLISCLSMAPFLFAEFLPTQQFAKLMIAMLCGAIIGDIFLLPALLLSPWGTVIKQRAKHGI